MEEVITILRSENERLRLENEHLCNANLQINVFFQKFMFNLRFLLKL